MLRDVEVERFPRLLDKIRSSVISARVVQRIESSQRIFQPAARAAKRGGLLLRDLLERYLVRML